MKRSEIIDLLEIIAGAYPNAKLVDPLRTVDAWMLAFGEADAGEIYKAARHHLNTCRFFPTIADIQQCRQKAKLIYSDNPLRISPARESDINTLSIEEENGKCIDVGIDWFSELGFDIGDEC